MKNLHTPNKINSIMNDHKFIFSKKFGQNFLIDENIIKKIISATDINNNTTVIEVGPGLGSLTQFLCMNSLKVIAYEIDKDLKEIHNQELAANNLYFIYDDFLKTDLSEYKDVNDISFVSNLPYYITTPIIEKLIISKVNFKNIIIMMQKEVGERILAVPKTKNFGALTVFIQTNFEVEKIVDVSRNCFMPKPNVDSVVLKLVPKKSNINNIKKFEIFTKKIFSQRRKKINNNLKMFNIDVIEAKNILAQNNIDTDKRAEELNVEEIQLMYNLLKNKIRW